MKKKDNENHGYLFVNRKDVKLDDDFIPLKEYPRPNLKRDSYLCLNGLWDICITEDENLPSTYVDKVMVPFSIESAYSRVNHLLKPNEIIYYHKVIKLPIDFRKQKTFIHFEGVDQICEVYIDNILVYKHIGGFTPFSVELPSETKDEFTIVLKVKDYTDSSYHTRGKQTLNVTGYFYSSSSGVYKPIWMESVDEKYIKNVIFTPDFDNQSVKVKVETDIDDEALVVLHNRQYKIKTNKEETISLKDDFHPWDCKNPYLYDVDIFYHNDSISSYFGIRKIEIKEIHGIKRIFLNNEPIFLSGLLDQGYYFIGNYTPKDYDEYRFDIKKTLELGFNCLRKHIKTELPIFYYECDKNGLLLIQDFPCGGDVYSFFWTVIPRILAHLNEKNLTDKRMARTSKEGKEEFIKECHEYLAMYHNNPSVIIYSIFNEGWGEFSPSKIYDELKKEEDTKLFDTASGWYDAKSDFYSVHTYTFPKLNRRQRKNRCFIISEMGGASLRIESHSYFDGFFGHGKAKSKEDLEKKYINLFVKKMKPQISKYGLNMTIYTQLADCETEYNGIFTYDRKVQKIPTSTLIKINEEIYEEFKKTVK